jgi:hypothetical protein
MTDADTPDSGGPVPGSNEALWMRHTGHFVLLHALIESHPDKPALLRAFEKQAFARHSLAQGSSVPDNLVKQEEDEFLRWRNVIAAKIADGT